jgi:ribosomal protein S18 acetylase RimI-like enzyme
MLMPANVINLRNSIIRFVNGLKRPSKRTNQLLMKRRGQSLNAFVIREATSEDIHDLALLHVKTWSETYGGNGPRLGVREFQWREMFKASQRDWFVLVIENPAGELVGFAKGQPYKHDGILSEFRGELNKFYVLRDYQRLGLGRKLLSAVAQRLISMNIHNMVLFGIPQNPSCSFHEAMGGERLLDKKGVFQGGYCWRDLRRLV